MVARVPDTDNPALTVGLLCLLPSLATRRFRLLLLGGLQFGEALSQLFVLGLGKGGLFSRDLSKGGLFSQGLVESLGGPEGEKDGSLQVSDLGLEELKAFVGGQRVFLRCLVKILPDRR